MSYLRQTLLTTRRSRCVLVLLVLLLTLAPRGVRADDFSTYNIIDLGTLGGPFSQALGINDLGQIVGGSLNATPNPTFPGSTEFRAFLWNNGVMSDLGTLGGPNSGANGINSRGQVVGWSTFNDAVDSNGNAYVDAVLWNGRQVTDLGNLGGVASFGAAVNGLGQVAGYGYNTVPDPTNLGFTEERAFLSDSGALRDLGTLGGPDADALGINDVGQITGFASINFPPGNGYAFLWSQGVMVDLGDLGGCECSTGDAINALGQVVGDAGTAIPDPSLAGQTEDHPALWYRGTVRDLGLFPGDPDAQALAINNTGQIVGQSGDQSGAFRAVLWQGGVVTDLNTVIPADSGWQLIAAQGINDLGLIVGTGVSPNGQVHGFLLTPGRGRGRGGASRTGYAMATEKYLAVATLPSRMRNLFGRHRPGSENAGYTS